MPCRDVVLGNALPFARQVKTVTVDGRLYTDLAGDLKEVVFATTKDLAKLSYTGLSEGYYVVGTGVTGAVEAMTIMGAGYFTIMMAAALTLKRPAPGYLPPGYVPAPPVGMKSTCFDHTTWWGQWRWLPGCACVGRCSDLQNCT